MSIGDSYRYQPEAPPRCCHPTHASGSLARHRLGLERANLRARACLRQPARETTMLRWSAPGLDLHQHTRLSLCGRDPGIRCISSFTSRSSFTGVAYQDRDPSLASSSPGITPRSSSTRSLNSTPRRHQVRPAESPTARGHTSTWRSPWSACLAFASRRSPLAHRSSPTPL